MRIGQTIEFVELKVLEKASSGDIRLSVEVKLRDFQGTNDSVWLEEAVFRDFVAALARIENERKGTAVLGSCSPDEFVFTVRSRDSLGHFVAEVSLSRYQYSGPTYWHTSISGGFELDPTSLPAIVHEFQALHELKNA